MGLRNGDEIFVWMLNKNKSTLNNISLIFTGMVDKNYLLKKYNTWTGEYSEDIEIVLLKEKLNFKNLNLETGKDIALWLKPIE